ncbi:MAG: carotenoid biosynthesis protein [Bacteroidales bacterium]|nr:carotenoid biosynthesis protein [Bacteroidales bacterium]
MNSLEYKEIRKFFVIFYTVGMVGMVLPFTFPLFIRLIPYALILSFGALMFFHTGKMDWKTILFFGAVFLVSFVVEAVGVHTGKIFGYYSYGSGLGLKLVETPVIIGANWLFMVYTTAAVVDKWKLHRVLKVVVAASMMLLYDLVLEQSAPRLDMWHWKDEFIPLQNYMGWFSLALIFHSALQILNIRIQNQLALLMLGCQFLFFLFLFILFKLML